MPSRNVQEVRPATGAGKFYPADAEFLGTMVARYLAGATADAAEGGPIPKAVIAPHRPKAASES